MHDETVLKFWCCNFKGCQSLSISFILKNTELLALA